MFEKKRTPKSVLKNIMTIISWVIFTILIIIGALLLYYAVSMRLYATKGDKFEPKFALYTIVSPSMVPNLNVYDTIVDLRVDKKEDIKVNDVITFISTSSISSGMTVTHRVVEIVNDGDGTISYRTKGDNNLTTDSSTAPYENVIGKVWFKIPQLGRLQFFIASKGGWLICVLIPALFIIVKDILKIIKLSNFKKKGDKQSDDKEKRLELPKKKKEFYNRK